ncbi:MAG: hypothetical protein GY719_28130 [bacterium]|nr:hypothetical protein [bacterium]
MSAATSRSELSAENMVSLLESARGISSDHEMSRLLRQLAEAHPIGDEAWPAFDRAMASIGSDHERQRVVVTTGR